MPERQQKLKEFQWIVYEQSGVGLKCQLGSQVGVVQQAEVAQIEVEAYLEWLDLLIQRRGENNHFW